MNILRKTLATFLTLRSPAQVGQWSLDSAHTAGTAHCHLCVLFSSSYSVGDARPPLSICWRFFAPLCPPWAAWRRYSRPPCLLSVELTCTLPPTQTGAAQRRRSWPLLGFPTACLWSRCVSFVCSAFPALSAPSALLLLLARPSPASMGVNSVCVCVLGGGGEAQWRPLTCILVKYHTRSPSKKPRSAGGAERAVCCWHVDRLICPPG